MNISGKLFVISSTFLLHIEFSKISRILVVQLCRSIDCFRLGWPMRADANFFQCPSEPARVDKDEVWNILNSDIC